MREQPRVGCQRHAARLAGRQLGPLEAEQAHPFLALVQPLLCRSGTARSGRSLEEAAVGARRHIGPDSRVILLELKARREFGSARDGHPFVDRLPVVLGGVLGDPERVGEPGHWAAEEDVPEHVALTAGQAVGVNQQRADLCWASSIDDNGDGAVGIAYRAGRSGRAQREHASVGKDHSSRRAERGRVLADRCGGDVDRGDQVRAADIEPVFGWSGERGDSAVRAGEEYPGRLVHNLRPGRSSPEQRQPDAVGGLPGDGAYRLGMSGFEPPAGAQQGSAAQAVPSIRSTTRSSSVSPNGLKISRNREARSSWPSVARLRIA